MIIYAPIMGATYTGMSHDMEACLEGWYCREHETLKRHFNAVIRISRMIWTDQQNFRQFLVGHTAREDAANPPMSTTAPPRNWKLPLKNSTALSSCFRKFGGRSNIASDTEAVEIKRASAVRSLISSSSGAVEGVDQTIHRARR